MRKSKAIITFFVYLVPLITLFCGFYFYIFSGVKSKVYATASDIQFIAQKIHDGFMGDKYHSFNNDTVVFNDFLPPTMVPIQSKLGYQIYNRFGGKMYFYEAFRTIEERSIYLSLYNNPVEYKKQYTGSGAYMILLTNLMKKECVMLARVNWRRFIPNFLGMEVSVAKPDFPYNGLYNLKHYLLVDNLGEQYKTQDEGLLFRRPISENTAEDACGCRWKNCMIALKFL